MRPPKTPTLLMLSGGPDSVYAFWQFLEKKIPFEVLHVNYKTRPESDLEESFVKALCQKNEVAFHGVTYPIREQNGNLQNNARIFRYQTAQQIRKDRSLQSISTAHHQDDDKESIILARSRGAGLKGLKGISFETGKVCRPFLKISKSEILAWLEQNKKDFCIDSSNQSKKYQRNRVRHTDVAWPNYNNDKTLLITLNNYWNLRNKAESPRSCYLTKTFEAELQFRLISGLLTKKGFGKPFLKKHIELFSKDGSMGPVQWFVDQTGLGFVSESQLFARQSFSKTLSINTSHWLGLWGLTLTFCNKKAHKNSPRKFPLSLALNKYLLKGPLVLKPINSSEKWKWEGQSSPQKIAKCLQDKHVPHVLRKCPLGLYDDDGLVAIPGAAVASRVSPQDSTAKLWLHTQF